jgi:hypothetical protein
MPESQYLISDLWPAAASVLRDRQAGIVHFNFFRYFEDAEHALWREAGLTIHARIRPSAGLASACANTTGR